MEGPNPLQMRLEQGPDAFGKHGHAVLGALGVAHRDLTHVEIDVLDPEPEAFHQPEAGTVEQGRHDPVASGRAGPSPLHFVAGQNHGYTDGPLGPHKFPESLRDPCSAHVCKGRRRRTGPGSGWRMTPGRTRPGGSETR